MRDTEDRVPISQPRLGLWVLRLLIPPGHRQLIVDDMAEEWSRRVAAGGERAARRWYYGEVLRSVAPALRLRLAPWHSRARPGTAPLPASPRWGEGSTSNPATIRGRSAAWRDRTILELRYAARRLTRAPGFALVAGSTLAVAVGANVAMFSLVDGVLLESLPFPDSDRLVAIRHTAPGLGLAETDLSDGTYVHYRAHNTVFEEMAYWQEAVVNITDATAEPERVPLVLVTRSFFPTLGVAPLLGPGFDPDASGGTQMVILSYRLWQRRYGADSTLIGRTVEVNHSSWRVMGVMPPGFAFPNPRVELWLDIGDPASSPDELRLGSFYYPGVGRLRPGVSPERAAADLHRLVPSLEGLYRDATPETLARARLTPVVVPLKDHVIRNVGSMLWPLLGAVVFVLLIACANVTNLYVVRSAAREREVMVRAALGAGRVDLTRHFLAESLLLAVAGSAFGLLLGWSAVRVLVVAAPIELPRLDEVSVGGRAVAFALVLSAGTGIILGLVPALRLLGAGIGQRLRSAGRAFTTSRERQRTQRVLVVVQVALALTLLIGSALMVQTFWNLRRVDPGFDARDVLTFEVVLPHSGYETYEKSEAFQRALLERIQRLPGVSAAGSITWLPMAPGDFPELPSGIEVLGPRATRERDALSAWFRSVTPGYFATVRTPIVAGRPFSTTDRAAGGAPVILSASLAAKLFPGENAVGKRIRRARQQRDPSEDLWNTVIGVAADVHANGVAQPIPDIVYTPVLDRDDPAGSRNYAGLAYAVRTSVPPMSLVTAVRSIVQELDAKQPIARIRTMQDIVNTSMARTTFITLLLGTAALAALLLGMIGIYGVLSYVVGQRRREIGLRVALGARHTQVIRLVLRDGLTLTLTGLAAGALTAALLTRFLSGLLYGVSPIDPLTFFLMAGLLIGLAFVACALPARQAAAVEPTEALAEA